MKRNPFVLRFKDGKKEEGLAVISGFWNECKGALKRAGIENFSIWSIEDFLFCYGEFPDEVKLSRADQAGFEAWKAALAPVCDVFAAQGTLPLMYHDIGIVRADKSLIRHRVFATKLKEGCAAEYKRRHDGLIEKRGDKITEGPEQLHHLERQRLYLRLLRAGQIVRSRDDRGGEGLHHRLGDPSARNHGLADRRCGLDHRPEARFHQAGRAGISV